jgi:hypothetical protein
MLRFDVDAAVTDAAVVVPALTLKKFGEDLDEINKRLSGSGGASKQKTLPT